MPSKSFWPEWQKQNHKSVRTTTSNKQDFKKTVRTQCIISFNKTNQPAKAYQIYFGILFHNTLVFFRIIPVPAIPLPIIVQVKLYLRMFIWGYACSCVLRPNFSWSLTQKNLEMHCQWQMYESSTQNTINFLVLFLEDERLIYQFNLQAVFLLVRHRTAVFTGSLSIFDGDRALLKGKNEWLTLKFIKKKRCSNPFNSYPTSCTPLLYHSPMAEYCCSFSACGLWCFSVGLLDGSMYHGTDEIYCGMWGLMSLEKKREKHNGGFKLRQKHKYWCEKEN